MFGNGRSVGEASWDHSPEVVASEPVNSENLSYRVEIIYHSSSETGKV